MLDIKFIKDNLEVVKTNNKNRGVNVDLNRLVTLYENKKKLLHEVEEWRAEKNKYSKKKPEEGIINKLKQIGQYITKHESSIRLMDEEIESILQQVPNLSLTDVPIGPDESANQVVKSWGTKPDFSFTPLDHVELGKKLDIIDIETAATVTGSGFNYLKNEAVLLQFALVQLVMHTLTSEATLEIIARKFEVNQSTRAFIPVLPPVFIKPQTFTRMARLSDQDKDERYYVEKDNMYLIGSAEHTLGPMHENTTFEENELPLRYIGYSTCFRREAGSYGKDVRGILRVHQFDKLEMESFVKPDDAVLEQNFFVAIQEYLMQQLEIPYQVVQICTGDMGLPDARQFDIEAWIPSQNKYRETHTSDLMTDYQSRRLNTKVKLENGELYYTAMNDATAFAVGRTLIALIENNQQPDGSIKIPSSLHKYLPFTEIKR